METNQTPVESTTFGRSRRQESWITSTSPRDMELRPLNGLLNNRNSQVSVVIPEQPVGTPGMLTNRPRSMSSARMKVENCCIIGAAACGVVVLASGAGALAGAFIDKLVTASGLNYPPDINSDPTGYSAPIYNMSDPAVANIVNQNNAIVSAAWDRGAVIGAGVGAGAAVGFGLAAAGIEGMLQPRR